MNRLYPKLPPGYITKSTIIVVTSGTALYAVAELLLGNESFYRKTVMPMVHRFIDGESAHRLGVKLAKYSLFPPFSSSYCEYPELECDLLGMHLRNPVGLAAGFDKDAEAVHGLRKSGFGMIEVGTVTPLPQEGNPAPRVFRLTEDEGIINRYGFNSAGVGQVYARVRKAYEPKHPVPLGINIGKNKSTEDAYLDYNIGVNYFSQYCDYLVVNISSPNTPGLRSMQKRSELQKTGCMMSIPAIELVLCDEWIRKLMFPIASIA
ncbi:hypothetical protein AB6A40_010249 [Gnathostoma spinigerum]|uniref:Dihydroorotate dehydrogenase (quinone), mitochondrial n=1 Tax=Gnathostoma spinigerum TaxID=75299 RepID=A0ABD6EU90_9BILA